MRASFPLSVPNPRPYSYSCTHPPSMPPPSLTRYVSAGSGDHCCSNEGYCCPKDNCFYTSNNRICGVRYKCCIAGEVLSEGDGATESDDVRHYPTGIYLTLQYPRWAGGYRRGRFPVTDFSAAFLLLQLLLTTVRNHDT